VATKLPDLVGGSFSASFASRETLGFFQMAGVPGLATDLAPGSGCPHRYAVRGYPA
jgi:hypothetical protein